MMPEEHTLHTKIEQTLNSLDACARAEANPFLYTRITAMIESRKQNRVSTGMVWKSVLGIGVVLALNIMLYVFTSQNTQTDNTLTHTETAYFTTTDYSY